MSLERVSEELRAVLSQLRGEHERITRHMQALEGMIRELGQPGAAPKARVGRPPAALAAASAPAGAKQQRKKPVWSAASREAAKKRAQAMWAARRKKAGSRG